MSYDRSQPKEFAYSYSRIAMFESCPKKYLHTMVLKDFPEPESSEMLWGKQVHKDMERAVIEGTYAPDFSFATDAQRVLDVLAKYPDAKVHTEQQWALTRSMVKTGWFDRNVHLRVIVDLAYSVGPVGVAIDWKTGKEHENSPQLLLTAMTMFVHFPELKMVRTEFGWLKTHRRTGDTYHRETIMQQYQAFQPRVAKLERAHQEMNFPAERGGLCKKWCPVKSCEHNGR